jgi:integrase
MERKPIKITIQSVAALEREGGRITDSIIRGFIARALPSGKIQFGFQYGSRQARRWISIGLLGEVSVAQARRRAEELRGKVSAKEDPAAEFKMAAARATNTVNHLLDQFLDIYVQTANDGKPLRTAPAIGAAFANHVRPILGSRCIYDLKRADIARVSDRLIKQYPRMASIVLAHLRTAFNWWQMRDEEFHTPIVRGVVKDRHKARDRVLNPEEIADLWRALDEVKNVPDCFPAYIKLLLLTGLRRNELAGMHIREIDGDTWTIPAERMKAGKPHVVPLIPALKELLPERQEGFVFSSNGRTPYGGFSRDKKKLDAAIGAIRRRERRAAMPAWVFHDLRRTARTLMAELGIAERAAEAVLGHVIGGVKGVYDRHKYLVEKTDALTRLAAHVDGIVHPRPNVVPMRKRAKRASSPA